MPRYIRALAAKRKKAHEAADNVPFDLFGQIPVTLADVDLWLRSLGLDPNSPRSAWYIVAYNVAEKVRQAKKNGDWPP